MRVGPRDFTLPGRAVVHAVVLIAVAVAVLWSASALIGPDAARVGYLTIMFLVGPARLPDPRLRVAAAAWAVAVTLAGFLVGPLGTTAVIVGLVVVCLVQGLFRVGEVAAMVRSPVNFVALAGIAQSTDLQWWRVAVGALIGAAVVLGVSFALPGSGAARPRPTPINQRLVFGATTAVGSIIVVVVGDALDVPFVGWALLSLCLILSVGEEDHLRRAETRVLGTVIGAVVATLVSLLPGPGPIVVAVLCGLACVAYLRAGRYFAFVVFLTPAILLTTTSDLGPLALGIGRIEAVAASAILALALTAVAQWCARRWSGASDDHPAASARD